MFGVVGQELAQPVAAGAFQFVAAPVGGHLVRLVHDHQVPTSGAGQALQHLGPPGEVQRDDTLVGHLPGAAAPGRQGRPVHQVERLVELLGHLPLPLGSQVGRGDDKGAGDGSAQFEFFQQQAGHNRLAGAGVVGQQETQAGLAEHIVVDGFQLVGEGVNAGDADGELGVIRIGQANTGGFGGQTETGRVAVQGWPAAFSFHLQVGQVFAFEQAGDEAGLAVEGDGFDQHPARAARLDTYHAHPVWPVRAGENGTDEGEIIRRLCHCLLRNGESKKAKTISEKEEQNNGLDQAM